ncbi:heavy metal translocating P-type ATPase [Nannocystis punicea]|uniref:Heavy metal translocating P-type ATPase n=1 Tax=Nannocystis punicea TaxID=2995304 RepID=A0ABY7HBH4_9BACT|nr:heavy metal translocating P-type ATPase [Nannocystis poenicansa]WAS96607.1 heavy metal translocating P-type ATPase [Nannocystis poenicansa]
MSWFQPLLNVINDLDEAVDRVTELFHQHVAPTIQEAAEALDGMIEGAASSIQSTTVEAADDFDARWQEFMVRRVDPLFGPKRTEHLGEMGGLEISPQEVMLNRRIGHTALAFLAIAVGGQIWPASLYLSVPISFTMMLPAYEMAVQSVKKQKRITYHVVSALNVTGIWLGGYYTPAIAATLFFFMGEKLLMVTQDRSQKTFISIFSKQPQSVWVLVDGVEIEKPFSQVLPGDVVVVVAGGYLPVDGTVIDGIASVDQQMLTGEAQPVEKAVGDAVYASTLVLAGRVHVRVDKAGGETVAAKIGEILNQTASYQLDLQSRGSKLAHDSAVPTLALGGLALATLGGESALAILNSSFGVTVRISAPITMLNLLNVAAQNAILLKDGRSLELLSSVDTVLFDKTGTLTISQPHVAAIHCVGGMSPETLLGWAAAAERRQTHPIALAVVAEAEARGLELPDIDNARYEVGYGILVEFAERTIQVGSDRFMTRSGIAVPPEILAQRDACHQRGHSLIMVAVDGAVAGAIELQPTIRPEVEGVLAKLRARGLKLMIISGDQEEPTRRLAEALGIDRHFANVLPEGKADLVERLQAEGHAVCFVGDGINDSIALKKANVSVSLRGATTVATDAAQVVLMQESLRQLPYLFSLSEDMERALKTGNAAGMIPGAINVAGVFLGGWGYYHALGLNVISMSVAMGIAMYPVYKYRKSQVAEAPGGVEPAPAAA